MLTDADIARHFKKDIAIIRRLVRLWKDRGVSEHDVYDAMFRAMRYNAVSLKYVDRILEAQVPRQEELSESREQRFRIPQSEVVRYLRKHGVVLDEVRKCAYCGEELPEGKRAGAVYCSPGCRLKAFRKVRKRA